jgi:hypothetical protein
MVVEVLEPFTEFLVLVRTIGQSIGGVEMLYPLAFEFLSRNPNTKFDRTASQQLHSLD